MTRHLLKLLWRRRGSHLLVTLEILVSFLVVFAVAVFAIEAWTNLARPLGFEWERVWDVQIERGTYGDDHWEESDATLTDTLLRELETVDWIDAAAGALDVPWDGNTRSWADEVDGRLVRFELNAVTDGFAEVMNLQVVAGRWFGPQDDHANWLPVVVDRELALELSETADRAVGQIFPFELDENREARIVGVVSDYRKHGELGRSGSYLFRRIRRGHADDRPPTDLVVKVAPNTPLTREVELVRRLTRMAPGWQFEVRPLARLRARSIRMVAAPLVAGGLVAGFLLLMVALGLVGVLWQGVTRRTRELGLRRALGASGQGTYRIVLLEVLLTALAACLFGSALVLQLPLLDLMGFADAAELGSALVLSTVMVLILCTVSALYPCHLASRIQPAEALHYE